MRACHLAALGILLIGATGPGVAADRDHPTVVELFTARGCAVCPPANAALGRLLDRPDVLPLSFSVTYWDEVRRDPLASREFTERQRAYARVGRREAGTPQFVLNGRFATPYRGDAELERAIGSADRGDAGPAIAALAGRVSVGADRRSAREADVWLVEYDPRLIRAPVGADGGRITEHRNAVRALTRLGDWRGGAATFRVPPARAGLRRAVLVQAAGGAIIAARVIG